MSNNTNIINIRGNGGGGCLSGLLQGMGCVVGVIIALVVLGIVAFAAAR